ncbi:ATP-binding protein [Streptomyces sp. H27-D2]|uniref:ATP-binding protein n=1 Tax=Streptomyces sp. H27-D2 TaxID=3046304 RepID=UPI002DBBA5FA|nr:ATP-binding protein [Streptomyces sp. H27-D2]MEC4018653.1 ATP-binding protein [Streptomyces sp. H27-D2]
MRAHRRTRQHAARVEYTLRRDDASARWARKLTSAFLAQGCESPPEEHVDDALLVVSELVANATRHGRSDCRLRLHVHEGLLTVEVQDDSPQRPSSPLPTETGESGRGIALVRHLSRRFEVTGAPGGGKTVRAVLAAC